MSPLTYFCVLTSPQDRLGLRSRREGHPLPLSNRECSGRSCQQSHQRLHDNYTNRTLAGLYSNVTLETARIGGDRRWSKCILLRLYRWLSARCAHHAQRFSGAEGSWPQPSDLGQGRTFDRVRFDSRGQGSVKGWYETTMEIPTSGPSPSSRRCWDRSPCIYKSPPSNRPSQKI